MSTPDAPKKGQASDKDILTEARERFAWCIDEESEERKQSLDDLKFAYEEGAQWPEDIRKQRGARPTHTNNRMPQFINQVVNEQRRSRPSITVSPVSGGANLATATVIQGMVRHIERISRAEVAYDNSFKYAVACGKGHFRINTAYVNDDSFDQELRISIIENPFTVYTGPHHEPDGIDATYRFVTERMKHKDFEAKYGFEPTAIDDAGEGDDNTNWFDEEEVRVAEYWKVCEYDETITQLSNGYTVPGELDAEELAQLQMMGMFPQGTRTRVKRTVEQYLMTGDKIIKKTEWAGKYIPIVSVVGGVVNIEGKKKLLSLIRNAKDAQRMDNYWSSAEAEHLALQTKAPWVGAEGSFDGHEDEWAKANTANLPYLEYAMVPGAQPPQRQFPTGTPTGFREARMAAIEDQKAIMGLYDASLGARSNEVSGVAIRARQQQGDIATYHFIDAMAKAIESAGRILIDLIPKVYDTERTIRIVKPDEQTEMVAINAMYTDPQTGQMTKHDLALGQYDVTVKVGPSFQSQREEARAAMMDLLQQNPSAGPVISDMIVAQMDFPEADKIAERLKHLVPPQALGQPSPPDPMLQLAQATEQAKTQREQMKMESDMQLKQSDMQMKQLDLQVEQTKLQMLDRQMQDKHQVHLMEMDLKRMEMDARAQEHQQSLELQRMRIEAEAAERFRNDQLRAMGTNPGSMM